MEIFDPTIIAAIISAIAVIAAAILTPILIRNQPASPPPPPPPIEESKTVSTHLNNVQKSKILRCGVVKHPPLCNFEWDHEGNLSFTGYYVELAKKVCHDNGLTPQFVPVEWTDIPHLVFDEMKLDLVLSVFETKQRSAKAEFTACYHKVNLTGLTSTDNTKVTEFKDLHRPDVRIVVTKGEAGWEYVTYRLRIPKHRLLVVESSNITEMMDYVISGKVDVAICDEVSCHEYAINNPKAKHIFIEDELDMCKNCIMVPQGQEKFCQWVESEFDEARGDPEIQKIDDAILSDKRNLIRRYI